MSVQPEQIVPRQVTDDEVRFFRENGWVHFRSLITPDEARLMREHLQEIMGADATTAAHPAAPGGDGKGYSTFFHTYEPLSIELATGEPVDDTFYAFSHSPELGRLGAALAGAPIRFWVDGALVKMPQGRQTGAGPTAWHTDIATADITPFDPPQGQMQLWVALNDIPPERGTMRFVAPSKIDDEVRRITSEHANDPEASYRLLEELGVLSEPLSMRAGDATVHASLTLHSAPPNRSDEPRWVYMCSLFPASARWSGNNHWALEPVAGLQPGAPFVDRRFPVLA